MVGSIPGRINPKEDKISICCFTDK
jgi:hypothetical protein